ncbi:MAG: hypothetical protein ACMUIU_08515 [bacterium]
MQRQWKITIIFFLLVVFCGCTHHYVPREYPINPAMVPELNVSQPIRLINVQPDNKETLLGKYMGHKWMGNLTEWTDVAVSLLRTELQKRDINVTEDASKELKLNITKAELIWGAWAIRCILNLRVETGDGYTVDLEGNNASPATLYRAIDGAVTKAVTAMLNDDNILNYLKK